MTRIFQAAAGNGCRDSSQNTNGPDINGTMPAIELRKIRKHYGSVRANDGIDLKVMPGTIHGILGENGAGKSTLMKILSGFIPKTDGTILIGGEEAGYSSPAGGAAFGIGMLYQEPLDFPPLSVLENFMAGRSSGWRIKRGPMKKELAAQCSRLGFGLNPDIETAKLTLGERQQLELMRLLASGTRVLILDEPTTGISAVQKEALFFALRTLASEGRSVILVSHKIEDIEALCDRITVLKDGIVAGSMDKPFDTSLLLSMMFGSLPSPGQRTEYAHGEPALRLEDVSAPGGRTGLKGCTVQVRRGEIVGLAGLEGSGQDVFLRVASGLVKAVAGRVCIGDKVMTGRRYHAFRKEGVAFQPAARIEEGLVRGLTVSEHCALGSGHGPLIVNWGQAMKEAKERIERFQVAGRPESLVESLSGGNQQRLLLSFLPEDSNLLLLENPTRGLDVESGHWVWDRLHAIAARGAAIVFSSPELDEILSTAERVLVFFEGRIVLDRRARDTDAAELGRAIAGKV